MDYLKTEKEISFKEIIYYILLKWRILFFLSVVGCVCTCGINIYKSFDYVSILGIKLIVLLILKQLILVEAIICCVFIATYFMVYVMSDTIKSVSDYGYSSNLKMIGAIPTSNENRKSKIDKIIKQCKGIKIRHTDREKYVERIVNVVENYISSEYANGAETVALVSSCSMEEVDELKLLIDENNQNDKISFVGAGNVMYSPEAIKIVTNAKYIIIVERIDKSKYSEFEQVCKQVDCFHKEIIGTVLLNADAV